MLYPKEKGTYTEKCISGLKEEIRKSRMKTKGIIGVNVMVALSNYADMVRTAINEKIDVIFSGAGLPLDLPVSYTHLDVYKRQGYTICKEAVNGQITTILMGIIR